jgi:hypothetical protein
MNITDIEKEIENLTKQRANLFEEWALIVKRNERDFENNNNISFETLQKADFLLKEQRNISKKILSLLDTIDDLRKINK